MTLHLVVPIEDNDRNPNNHIPFEIPEGFHVVTGFTRGTTIYVVCAPDSGEFVAEYLGRLEPKQVSEPAKVEVPKASPVPPAPEQQSPASSTSPMESTPVVVSSSVEAKGKGKKEQAIDPTDPVPPF